MPDCSSPPVWLAFVQPFATVFLGLGAAALAYRQWLTANEKLRLDLFDRRSEAAREIEAVSMDMQMAGSDGFNGLLASGAVDRAMPLFAGKEAQMKLQALSEAYVRLWREARRLSRIKLETVEYDDVLEVVEQLEQQAVAAHAAVTDALRPYLTFHARDHRLWR